MRKTAARDDAAPHSFPFTVLPVYPSRVKSVADSPEVAMQLAPTPHTRCGEVTLTSVFAPARRGIPARSPVTKFPLLNLAIVPNSTVPPSPPVLARAGNLTAWST